MTTATDKPSISITMLKAEKMREQTAVFFSSLMKPARDEKERIICGMVVMMIITGPARKIPLTRLK